MKPILTPTATETVRCVRETIQKLLAPALEGRYELSYATTAGHLLAYVEKRLEGEGQILLDEAKYLKKLLPEAVTWLNRQPDTNPLNAAIIESLAFQWDPDVYVTLTMLSDHVAELRQHVCDILLRLQAVDDADGGAELHDKLRTYIAWQLDLEQPLVETSFRGRGPRR